MPPDQAYDIFEGLEDIQRVLARELYNSVNQSFLATYEFMFYFELFGTYYTDGFLLTLPAQYKDNVKYYI